MARRGEVEPGAARLERDDEQWRPDAVLEIGHHRVPARLGDAAVEERCVHLEPLTQVDLEQVAHLAELGEDQRPLVDVEQLGDELVEAVQLARAAGEA